MINATMLTLAAAAVAKRLPWLTPSQGVFLEYEEAHQEAWVAALTTIRHRKLRPAQAVSYLQVAIRRYVTERSTMAYAPVHLSRGEAYRMYRTEGQFRTVALDALDASIDMADNARIPAHGRFGGVSPHRRSPLERAAIAALTVTRTPEEELDSELRAATIRAAVARVLAALPPIVGDVVRRLFGLDCLPLTPAATASELGIPRRQVTEALASFTSRARNVPALQALASE